MESRLQGAPPLFDRPGMPTCQVNAYVGNELVMRVGVPHKGGALSFHAFNQSYPIMVSAAAFWSPKTRTFAVPEATNLTELDMALDSAGFTAMANWKAKGAQPGMAGIYPWSYTDYIELASRLSPAWYSQADACCEPEIVSSQAEIDHRINLTATLLEGTLRVCYAWQNELARDCSPGTVASLVPIPVPVIQGWTASDYLRSLDLLMQVWERWQPWIAPPALIGVGSVCRRSLKDPKFGLLAILAALEGKLPTGSKLHMFGIKGAVLSELKMLDWVGSADSMAWDLSARMKALKVGQSNSMAHRSQEMTSWMKAAARRIEPAPGDQFRLGLFA